MILGIDPGQSGGLAFIAPDGLATTGLITAVKMPETERDIFLLIYERHIRFAIIEKVGPARGKNEDGSSRKQGVSSAFTFGQSYGFLRGLLVALEIPFQEVHPLTWQREFGLIVRGAKLTQTQRKNRNKQKAENLFPDMKITHAIADALLLAEYGRRIGK